MMNKLARIRNKLNGVIFIGMHLMYMEVSDNVLVVEQQSAPGHSYLYFEARTLLWLKVEFPKKGDLR